MKITLTGSLGHIGKPLAQELMQKGHSLTIVSSKPERKQAIEALGAKAAIGTMQDVDFLTKAFTGADVVYAMETAGEIFRKEVDIMETFGKIGRNYKQAIEQSGVKRVIHLSSIGAHTDKGNGMLAFHYYVENTLRELPNDVAIKFMRPVGFYYNMFSFIPVIKSRGAIIQNYGGDEKKPWVAPVDIASVIAEEMEKPFEGRPIRYIASEEISPNELAKLLGNAIGKPDLKWVVISDEQMLDNLLKAGMPAQVAKGFVEMQAAMRGNVLYQDYELHRPVLSKTKLVDFAKEFAAVYNQN